MAINNGLFVNVSNHPLSKWSHEQIAAARDMVEDAVGEVCPIVDLPFPNVPSQASKDDVTTLAWGVVAEIERYARTVDGCLVVLVQGEMTLTFAIVNLLRMYDTYVREVVAACSERITTEYVLPDGTTKKESAFKFVAFRPYF